MLLIKFHFRSISLKVVIHYFQRNDNSATRNCAASKNNFNRLRAFRYFQNKFCSELRVKARYKQRRFRPALLPRAIQYRSQTRQCFVPRHSKGELALSSGRRATSPVPRVGQLIRHPSTATRRVRGLQN